MKLCECGCGLEVNPGCRFRRGHNIRVNNPIKGKKLSKDEKDKIKEIKRLNKLLKEGKIELPFCKCGCGGRVTKIGNEYIAGHHNKVDKYKNANRERHLGKPSPMEGKHHSKESNQKNREKHLGKKLSKTHKDNIGKSLKGKMCGKDNPAYGKPSSFRDKKHTDEAKEKNREKHLGKKRSEESCINQSETMKRQFINGEREVWCQGKTKETEEGLMRISESMIGDKNPLKRPEVLRKVLKAVCAKPNKAEQNLYQLLQGIFPNEYKFVGDGSVIIGGKCPDFIGVNSQKKLIELYGDYWHRNDDEGNRIFYFRLLGYETLIVWEYELKDLEKLRQRILDFHNLV
jgi:G:T-mismatch repair DNA endonuclease (very short patch repair protein)